MKKILMITLLAATVWACNKDLESEGISRITYFPEFVKEGEDFYIINENEEFVDPGITVLEQGQEIPFSTTFQGRYSGYTGSTIGEEADQYSLVYNAVNKEGFPASSSRTIVKVNTGDLVNSISGLYSSKSVRVSGVTYDPVRVLIWEVEPNVYEISCSVGGFYADGRGDGDVSLARGGTIVVNDLATNDFTFTPAFFESFQLNVAITSMTVDPATKTITFVSEGDFANGKWTVTLTQIQP